MTIKQELAKLCIMNNQKKKSIVSFGDAMAYSEKLSTMEKKMYRQ